MIDSIEVIGQFAATIISSIAGTYIYMNWRFKFKNRPLSKILSVGDDEIRFIFAHRDVSPFVLPRSSTEDVLAMNNVISALLLTECRQVIKLHDTDHLSVVDKKKNLFTFCSSKSNKLTLEVEEELMARGLPIYRFKKESNGQTIITNHLGFKYLSSTFDEEAAYLETGIKRSRLLEQRFHDLAIITRAPNPWNAVNKVFIVAGIRGIGTWGAAECLKKNWKTIYSQLGKDKNADFSALVAVVYENCDIVESKVIQIEILKPGIVPRYDPRDHPRF